MLNLNMPLFTESGRRVTEVMVERGPNGKILGKVEGFGGVAWNLNGTTTPSGLTGFTLTNTHNVKIPDFADEVQEVLARPLPPQPPTRLFGISPTANRIWHMDTMPQAALKVPDFQVRVFVENGKVTKVELA